MWHDFHSDEIFEYLRKSRSDDPCLSVEEVLKKHERILRDYAEKHLTGKIPENHIFREIASSETIDGRPELLRLLKSIEDTRIKAVLVVEVQRLSRGDLEDAGRLIKLLRYTNTKVITPQKTYDLQDEYDRDIFERELKRGNEYLEYFKKIQARGRLASVQEGNYIGSIPPYGYDKVFVTVEKKKCPTLAENNAQAEVVRMIFDLYVNKDMGIVRIADYLDALGIAPPKGVHWSPAALRDMLQNVHYIGKVRWNRRKTVNVVENQEVLKTRPTSEQYLTFDGKHTPIISDELFEAAQKKHGRNPRAKSDVTVRNPLASLLFCRCGRAMSLHTYKDRSAPRLICDDQTHCHSGSVRHEEMIDCICEIMRKCIADFTVKADPPVKSSRQTHTALIKHLENKLDTLEKKELHLWETYSDKQMPEHIFQTLKDKLQKERSETETALTLAQKSVSTENHHDRKSLRFSDALAALKNPDISAALKNRYLKTIFERIIYHRERPVRITKERCSLPSQAPEISRPNGSWYSPPFELDVFFRK
ncbi:MAG: recombinase family protein [Marvinbryantia sp.]|uniref:recombinase family protein n=1 Tax=Marvinbryantia sp. TaxID=2496532 RepID=UPI00399BD21C